MTTRYEVLLEDETGCEFILYYDGGCKSEVLSYIEEEYPESRVLSIMSQQEAQEREEERYRRLEYDYDYDMR